MDWYFVLMLEFFEGSINIGTNVPTFYEKGKSSFGLVNSKLIL